ncbi:MAG: aminomethyltransferase family protein [Planctomycetota bacterium]|jgi:aminomethyltransferase|nr:aminomethyltransferase family protein [Planctomycetota bacterium]
MGIGTPFHPRTKPLCESESWKDWAGYLCSCRYQLCHEPEYFALRQTAGLIDISPLYKYRVWGPEALQFIDRLVTRNMEKVGVGRVAYAPWCDAEGKTLDDGTVQRLGENEFRITSANPSYAWFTQVAHSMELEIVDESEKVAALALQGPSSREILESVVNSTTVDLPYFGIVQTSMNGMTVEVSRTGFTGDLGYEIWVDATDAPQLWDHLIEAGEVRGLLPVGLDALDIARIEAGLILMDVDFLSSRHSQIDAQAYSPFELSLDWAVHLNHPGFIGYQALYEERKRGPHRRLVGLECDWDQLQALYHRAGLPVQVSSESCREAVPVYRHSSQVGKVTSTTWSPILKRMIALGTVEASCSTVGTRLDMEWTVEAVRHAVTCQVVKRPFYDPPHKRGGP